MDFSPESIVMARDLETVRRRRADLREVLNAFEDALAAPAAGRAVVWGERVHEVVGDLVVEFAEHVDVTEGRDGLHEAILTAAVRLANAVDALTEEHGVIAAEIASLVAATEPPVTAEDVTTIREQGTQLLGHIVRHRQRGADLIYEAYDTDIGGGD